MKASPLLFAGPMIRALLDGRKTQTRRFVKPQPEMLAGGDCRVRVNRNWHTGPADYLIPDVMPRFACPYGRPSDLLYVRETHHIPGGYLDAHLVDEIRQAISALRSILRMAASALPIGTGSGSPSPSPSISGEPT